MEDSELIALAALAQIEAVLMAGDNEMRKMQGHVPAWFSGCGYPPVGLALYDELQRRGLLR